MPENENNLSLAFEERLYDAFLRDPHSVPQDWQNYFLAMGPRQNGTPSPRLGPAFRPHSIFHENGQARRSGGNGNGHAQSPNIAALQHSVDQLVRNYRVRGHMIAHLDPLGRERPQPPELDPAFCGLSDADLDRVFSFDAIGPCKEGASHALTLGQILQRLRNTYCRSIGVQFMHIDDLVMRQWLQMRMEGTENRLRLSRQEQFRILQHLTGAVVFETFIQRKYIGAKSFSLEGSETLIPLLDLAIEKAGEQGIEEIVMGMAHRGRLNVLANIVGKPAQDIFREFQDADPRYFPSGDVKYHLGHSNDWRTAAGKTVHLSLCFNPSHLEFINPVVEGRLRAKQDRSGDLGPDRGMALLIHGDASFAGEGIVQETLNLSQLRAYYTGGTLHIIVNNQIGFVTSPDQARSSTYATDIAKMLQVPLFHVNGEDPEAAAQVVRLAMDFRQRFKRDVVIDMYCYRRLGHSEGDEPAFTQPLLYQAIAQRVSVRDAYLEHLLAMGEVTRQEAQEMVHRKTEALEAALADAAQPLTEPKHGRTSGTSGPAREYRGKWAAYRGGLDDEAEHSAEIQTTAADASALGQLLLASTRLPDDFHPHRKIERWLAARREMAEGTRPLDWSAAEALAFASVTTLGFRVRMSGQDAERGTFSQRHAVLHDVQDDHTYVPLAHVAPDQSPFQIFNSPLSEAGVLGFEYGYSLDCPNGLVLWEAQYGDFVNTAQVIIDQFITNAEKKWNRLSGLTLLLPHGFEGHGPEHSSARVERWLTLTAEHNIRVVYPTTPAQYFHCLRRQVLGVVRKPLVVLTPKSLLRHPEVVSSLEDCAAGRFQKVIPDLPLAGGLPISRVFLCAGKIYYELRKRRQELERTDIAIIRLEQLYPLPMADLRAAFKPYVDATPVIWVQEEPHNMGAWPYLRGELACGKLFDRMPFSCISRLESASPATGSTASHKLEQEQLLARAFEQDVR